MDIQSVREELGESQAEFAKRLGVDQSTVSRWEAFGLPERGFIKIAVEKMLEDIK